MKNAMAMDNKEQHIRETAYRLWEQDGRPHGQAQRHWDLAQKLAGNAAEVAPQQSAPPARPARETSAKTAAPARKRSSAR
jgi:Protein of unknown function (DUF2934)